MICHEFHPSRRAPTPQPGEHCLEFAYDGVTVADPGTTVDDQQDSFNYHEHRMLFHFTNTLPAR
jgi:hypothetical protein